MVLILFAVPCIAQEADIDQMIRKGQRQVQAGNLPLAYETFKEILKIEPRNSTAMNALAQIATFLKMADEAVLYYTAYLYVGEEFFSAQEGGTTPEAQEVIKARQKQEAAIPKPAQLTIRALPSDAEIFVNGLPVGRGEITFKVASGKGLALSATAEDYTPVQESVVLQHTEIKTVQLALKKIIYRGKLKTKVSPASGVKVFVDAKPAGGAGEEVELTEGRHLVCFKKEGFDRWWRFVEVPRNGTVVLEASLREASRPDEPCDVLWEED